VPVRQRFHREAPLRAPRGAFGAEHPVHSHLAKHGLDVRRAAIGLGPSAENRFVESRVGDAEDAIRSEAILIQRSVLRRPVLLDQVEAPDVHLQEIPEQWHSFRPREIIEGPTRRDA
jgi:hypothetical protein